MSTKILILIFLCTVSALYCDAEKLTSSKLKNAGVCESTNQVDFMAYVNSPEISQIQFNVCVKSFFRDQHKTEIVKILKITKPFTKIWSTNDSFIEDAATGEKYYIISSSVGIIEQCNIISQVEEVGTCEISEIYPILPEHVKIVNIGVSDKYFVKNLQIR